MEREVPRSDEYVKRICGFANAQGGKFCIGVDDSEGMARIVADEGGFCEYAGYSNRYYLVEE